MATTIVHTIGTATRDYSTVQAWEDASPANLVTVDEIWQGQAYNDAEFVSGSPVCTFAGVTTDATRYIELTAAAGQSFQDQAGVRTNHLTYDASKGVALRFTGSYVECLDVQTQNVHMSRLQVASDGSQAILLDNSVSGPGGSGGVLKDMIFIGRGGSATVPGLWVRNWTLTNILYIVKATPATVALRIDGSTMIGSTIAKTTDVAAAGVGINAVYGSAIMESCAIFGFTTPTNGSGWDTTNSKNNATDAASGLPGTTANQLSVTYNGTTPFTQASLTGNDMRAIASTALAANGFKDATLAPNDISGTTRSATPTIGAWELTGSVIITTGPFPTHLRV